MRKETKTFQAETKQLLNMMINSIYTHKEIFLRELISNSSDAIDKVKFQSLTNPSIVKEGEIFEIFIKADQEKKTLTISDNGIGMSYNEVIENIGTIAHSGSKSFISKLKEREQGGGDLELIGQFGVGFYSAFMVADKVILETKSPESEKGVKWSSLGDGSYEVEEIDKTERGTSITLYLREKEENDETWNDYLNEFTLRNLIKKYSDFIRYSIKMEVEKTEYPKDEEGNIKEDAEPIKRKEVETINAMKPIWLRDKKDIKQEDYNSFYKQEFHDWVDPTDVIHTKAEGKIEYTALLFIPSKAPFDLYSTTYKKGVKLYSKNVFIMEQCEELIPDYFKFVKGLVDSSDFSLNISREILQHNTHLKIISKNLEKKIKDSLLYLQKSEREKYVEFWKEFGKNIKNGLYSDFNAKEKLSDLLIFPSSNSEEMTTLKEYVERMKEDQTTIYYAVGKDRESIEKLPQMEILKDKGWEVLYFVEKIDEFITNNLTEYDGKKLQSISRGDFEVDQDEKTKENLKKQQEDSKDLLEAIKEALGEKVKDVKLSSRLKSSPVCLVSTKDGISLNMEKVLKDYDSFVPKAERVLEINPDHSIYKIMQSIFNQEDKKERFNNFSELLYEQALLMEGITPEDPIGLASKITSLMVELER